MLKHCGFTLTEINELLTLRSNDSACCDDIRRLAVEKKFQLEPKIPSMKVMSNTLEFLIVNCPDQGRPIGDCPILGAMDQIEGLRT